jgi:two-component system CheB/CheR fusion protein
MRSEGLRIDINGREQLVNLQVVPIKLPRSQERTFLILFEDAERLSPATEKGLPRRGRREEGLVQRVAQLKQELGATKAYLQSVIENQEASNEELRSLNEEILSTNEELQSTTEELETSNEELQSANEELTTLNEELQNRNAQLSLAHNDILNLLSSMNVSVIFVDRDLRIRRITPTAEKVLHLLPSDMGRPLKDIRLNLEIPDLEPLLLEAINAVKTKNLELLDSEGRWYSMQIRPYVTAEKKIDGAVLSLTDIHDLSERTRELFEANQRLQQELTMRQQAEEAVRGGEERFRLIADALPVLLAYVDANQCYLFNNKAYEQWFGVKREQLRGRPMQEVIGKAAYGKLRPLVEEALAGKPVSYQGYVPYAEASRYVHLDYMPQKDDEGRVAGFYVLIRDLTELKLAEEKFRAFVESAPDAMLIVDQNGSIAVSNLQAERMFGYSRDELAGQPVERLVPIHLRDQHLAHRTAYLRDPQARPMGTGLELYAVRKDGKQFPVEISLSPIQTVEGVLISSIIRDITDRRLLEVRNRQAAVLEERDRLARDVHDNLAQGLAGVVLQLEGAEEVLTTNPEEMRKHIAQARDLARASLEEARRSLLAMQPAILDKSDLPNAIEQAVTVLRQQTSARIESSVRGNPQPLPRQIQETLLRIAQEALRNAVRHGKANEVRVELAYDAEGIGICVEDNGRGFVPNKAHGHRGLGLTIMKDRAAQIGADFNVRSKPGKGTRVEVRVRVPSTVPEGP